MRWYPRVEVRHVEAWAVYEFGDSITTRLAAGELVAYWVTVGGETYAWPQADKPGLDAVYRSPCDIPAGELRDLATDMWTDAVAEIGDRFRAGDRTVTIRAIECDDRGQEGAWKTGYVLASAAGEEPVRYQLDDLVPEATNLATQGGNFTGKEIN
ncbi:hypothetical protein BU198_04805 [Streptomyces sp. CBMA156]|nr:hypothetical protein [Streptomyces sp. CBMA156]